MPQFSLPDFQSRTHTCGDLRASHLGQKVGLCGWVQSVRKAGADLLFIVVRDRFGVTQVVYQKPEAATANGPEAQQFQTLVNLSPESVVAIEGTVTPRPKDMVKKVRRNDTQMPTGEIEVTAQKVQVLNAASNLPFSPEDSKDLPKEEIRLKHRHLDLRRTQLQQNLQKRSTVCHTVRRLLIEEENFLEIETPMLFKSTPEGAREFLVPTRTKNGFFALPQSPQQFKQLLMVGGADRYFQIARCFRDEDSRSDRQPEFTQIDIEMSFVNEEDVMGLVETTVQRIWQATEGVDILSSGPLPRLAYQDAISKYGSDKPDLRYGLEIRQLDEGYFTDGSRERPTLLECLVIPDQGQFTRKNLDALKQILKESEANHESQGLHCVSSFSLLDKYASSLNHARLSDITKLGPGHVVAISERSTQGNPDFTTLGRARIAAAQVLESKSLLTISPQQLAFTWIHSFPLFTPELDDQGQVHRLASTHHPFTSPMNQDLPLLETAPQKVRAKHYDLVLNGMEIAGGSIRIHSPELQAYILEHVLKLPAIQRGRFRHLLDAFQHGCPPHGGIALGLDRLVSILCGASSIREVIAFPKSSSGHDLLMGSPSEITNDQLATYKIQLSN
ncbi:aspartate--tRNA ligase msd1 [Dimargaris cristalligena]|nr:aspartate--tRNA ligase msd1 [Dimargaris cristalligena]